MDDSPGGACGARGRLPLKTPRKRPPPPFAEPPPPPSFAMRPPSPPLCAIYRGPSADRPALKAHPLPQWGAVFRGLAPRPSPVMRATPPSGK